MGSRNTGELAEWLEGVSAASFLRAVVRACGTADERCVAPVQEAACHQQESNFMVPTHTARDGESSSSARPAQDMTAVAAGLLASVRRKPKREPCSTPSVLKRQPARSK